MKIGQFVKHKPLDRTDPGFTVPGRTLRWVSGKVSENNPGRPWAIIRKADCPPELIKHLENYNAQMFTNGDVIRRGDLVLAWAPNEIATQLKKEIKSAAIEQEDKIRRAPDHKGKDGKNRISVEVNESKDVTQEMIARFKQEQEE